MNEYVPKMIDDQYQCPNCDKFYKILQSLRTHCYRKHNITVLKTAKQSFEGRRRKGKEKLKAKRIAERKKKQETRQLMEQSRRSRTVHDAAAHGVHMCEKPIVEYRQSKIPDAGKGIFAVENLFEGDIVTKYEGKIVETLSRGPDYAVAIAGTKKFIDGIRSPIPGKGLCSFINRESREKGYQRKNCDLYQDGNKVYAIMTKSIKAGDECIQHIAEVIK
ncbi:hypothetical protein AC1031_006021 [Aphanomyces cochlioides]|nr:hypothetical protein AC1031_006021 [Aphanomyces cochlioides]